MLRSRFAEVAAGGEAFGFGAHGDGGEGLELTAENP